MGAVVDKLQDIKAWATSDFNILYDLLPGGKIIGDEFTAGSLRGEEGNSLKYNTKTGIWKDFATGESGGDIFDLICAVRGVTLSEAVEYAVARVGATSNRKAPTIKKKKTITELTPAPLGIPAPTSVSVDGKAHAISNLWAYHDHTGRVLMYDVRVDFTDGSKAVLPMHWGGDGWHKGTIQDARPLYNLNRIPEARSIVIVEGCKTAAAMEQYFPNSTIVTWQGGSNAIARSDWTPISNKERVIIIPDADNKVSEETGVVYPWEKQPGQKAALQIAEILAAQDNKVYIVDTRKMAKAKDGWDMADALADGWDKQRVLEFINKNLYPFGKEPEDVKLDDAHFEYDVAAQSNEEKVIKGFDCDYYKVLGRSGKKYYFYQKTTKVVMELTSKDLSAKGIQLELAPRAYWEQNFASGRKNAIDWEEVTDHLIQESQKAGIYDVQAVRGRGAWKDDDKVVINVGNGLIVLDKDTPARVIESHALDTKYVYETKPRLNVVLCNNPLPDKYSQKLIECCRLVRWKNKDFGDILAGWLFASFIGGTLPLRSHLYIAGAKESGKSWVVKNIVNRVLGDYKLSVGGVSTEAGIRSALGSDCFPVIFDESEAEDNVDKERMQRIFNLARLAATNEENNVAKGSASGEAVMYSVRSSFLFASINSSMTRDADLSRTIKVTIKDPPLSRASDAEKKQDSDNFVKLERFVNELITPEYRSALFTRAISLCDNMLKSVRIISEQAALMAGSKRFGDQMGMILAGIWHLKTSAVIDEASAREMITRYRIVKSDEAIQYSKTTILEWFSQREVSFNEDGQKHTYKIYEILSILSQQTRDIFVEKKQKAIRETMAQQGILIDSKTRSMYLSTSKGMAPCAIFSTSMWGIAGWTDAIMRIEGARRLPAGEKKFGSFADKGACIEVPLDVTDEY